MVMMFSNCKAQMPQSPTWDIGSRSDSYKTLATFTDSHSWAKLNAFLRCQGYSLSSVGQVKPHDPVVRLQERGEHGKVGGTPGVRLHVDAPLLRRELVQLQCPLTAKILHLVHTLGPSIVPDGQNKTMSLQAIRTKLLTPNKGDHGNGSSESINTCCPN